jgi:hypothetical protein
MVPQISKHEPDGLRATIGHQGIIKELNMTSIDLNLIHSNIDRFGVNGAIDCPLFFTIKQTKWPTYFTY